MRIGSAKPTYSTTIEGRAGRYAAWSATSQMRPVLSAPIRKARPSAERWGVMRWPLEWAVLNAVDQTAARRFRVLSPNPGLHLGVHTPRTIGVHRDSGTFQLAREIDGMGLERSLGGLVGAATDHLCGGGDDAARHVDDPAPTAFTHTWHCRAAEHHRRDEVELIKLLARTHPSLHYGDARRP